MLAAASVFLTLETPAADDLSELLAKCAPNVHPVTMSALIRHESRSHPYAILDNGNWSLPRNKRVLRSFQPKNQTEAITLAKKLIAAGHVVDMGLGQVNHRNLKKLGLTVEQIFDPCINLQASQTILVKNYLTAAKQFGVGDQALYAALSAYNTGNFTDGFTNGYVRKVLGQLADNAGKAKPLRPQPRAPRKNVLLEAKVATIEVETF
jgi:type IV secretion system protein VirB1